MTKPATNAMPQQRKKKSDVRSRAQSSVLDQHNKKRGIARKQ